MFADLHNTHFPAVDILKQKRHRLTSLRASTRCLHSSSSDRHCPYSDVNICVSIRPSLSTPFWAPLPSTTDWSSIRPSGVWTMFSPPLVWSGSGRPSGVSRMPSGLRCRPFVSSSQCVLSTAIFWCIRAIFSRMTSDTPSSSTRICFESLHQQTSYSLKNQQTS